MNIIATICLGALGIGLLIFISEVMDRFQEQVFVCIAALCLACFYGVACYLIGKAMLYAWAGL